MDNKDLNAFLDTGIPGQSPVDNEQVMSPVHQKSFNAFFEIITLFDGACKELQALDSVDFNPIRKTVENIIALMIEDDRMFMGLSNSPYSYIQHRIGGGPLSDEIIIFGVNTMIYSLKISIEFGVAQNHLIYVGVASLCSNVGLLDLKTELNAADKIRKSQEYFDNSKKMIRKIKIDNFHAESIEFLNTLIKEDQQVLTKTSLQESMYQYALIIHLCGEFIRLTHKDNFGKVLTPIDAMKQVRNEMDGYFNQDIIKLFFNKLSIYPLGSFVKLSSGETAKIIGINDNFIMRPMVAVVLDSEGREKNPVVKINLREKPNIYIKHPVVNEQLTERFITLL